MKAKTAAAKIVAAMDKRADDGLLDLGPLRAVQITGKADAVEATDKEFLDFIAKRLAATLNERRLSFRLLILAACELIDVPEAVVHRV